MKDKRTYLASYYGTVDKRSLEQQICGPMWEKIRLACPTNASASAL